jgi:hypothetical protein
MAVKKAVAKKATAKKPSARDKSRVGNKYQCGVCGMAVTVDEDCGCTEAHDIICCRTPMKKKRASR